MSVLSMPRNPAVDLGQSFVYVKVFSVTVQFNRIIYQSATKQKYAGV